MFGAEFLGATKLVTFIGAVIYTIIGLMIFFSGEIFTAIREIALNSRAKIDSNSNTDSSSNEYNGLITATVLSKVIGVIIIAGSWLLFFFVLVRSTPRYPF